MDSPLAKPGEPLALEETARFVRRVQLSREGSAVERCHQLPHVLRYSVGHHTLDAVTLVTLGWQAAHGGELPSKELLVATAFHDIPERVVGDVPSPTKRLLDGKLDRAEAMTLDRLGVAVVLSDEELAYLNGADRVELWLWAYEEAELRGNVAARSFLEGMDDFFDREPPPWPMMDLIEYIRTFGMERLPGNLMKEWGE